MVDHVLQIVDEVVVHLDVDDADIVVAAEDDTVDVAVAVHVVQTKNSNVAVDLVAETDPVARQAPSATQGVSFPQGYDANRPSYPNPFGMLLGETGEMQRHSGKMMRDMDMARRMKTENRTMKTAKREKMARIKRRRHEPLRLWPVVVSWT